MTMNQPELEAGLAPTPGYRYADVVDNRLFVAGQVPLDRNGELQGGGDPAAQATACLDNLLTLLGGHGFSVADLRQLTVYVVGRHRNLTDAWSAVVDWFNGDVPPATLLGVNLLGYQDQLVEIDAVVIRTES